MGDTTYATATTKRCYATMGEILPQLDIKPDSNEKTKAAKQIIKKNLANKHKMNIEPIPLIDCFQILFPPILS